MMTLCLYVSVDNERWAAGVPAGRLQGWERASPDIPPQKPEKAFSLPPC